MSAATLEGGVWRDTEELVEPVSYYGAVGRRFLHDPASMVALVILLLIIGSTIAAPVITGADPLHGDVANRLMPLGSPGHVLGTDEQGRDMVARLLYGGRVSLLTGLLPVVIATIIGTTLGALAAYIGGAFNNVVMRIMDVSYAFPAILLAIAISASLGPGASSAIIAITIIFIAPVTRVAESATRQVVVQEYIEAARASGASSRQVLFYQLLPNIFSPIFVYAAGTIGLSIIIAAGLSFLGLGEAPPTPEWGYMLNSLRDSTFIQPVIVILPGVMIFLTATACNVVSDGLRDALDIRSS